MDYSRSKLDAAFADEATERLSSGMARSRALLAEYRRKLRALRIAAKRERSVTLKSES